jgi:hypothetical protein
MVHGQEKVPVQDFRKMGPIKTAMVASTGFFTNNLH